MKTLLQGIGIIFTLIASFLGNLYFIGDVIISAFISSVIVVVLYFLQETFIKKKNEITKNRLSSTSIILWLLYLLLSVPITFSLIHSLNVELNEKKNIQQIAVVKQDELTNMLDDFNKKYDDYLAGFQTTLDNKLRIYRNDKNDVSKKIPTEKLHQELLKTPFEVKPEFFNIGDTTNPSKQAQVSRELKEANFKLIKDSVISNIASYNKKYKTVFSNWSRLSLIIASTELDKTLNLSHTQMANGFAKLTGGTKAYQYPYNKLAIEINHPKDLWNKHKPYMLLLVVFLFHLLILLPYIIEPVAGRYINTKKANKPASGGIQI
jgi:hypothetical protein